MLWLWQRFLGLNAVRLAASIHIVLGHLQKQGALRRSVGGVYVLRWGFTWVPWFFMLSGFVLTHARMKSRVKSSGAGALVLFLKKRMAAPRRMPRLHAHADLVTNPCI